MKSTETNIMKTIITAHLIGEKKKTKKERGDYFYVSESYLPHNIDDSSCPRQLGYKVLKYEEAERDDGSVTIFALGDLYHEFIQKIFVKEKIATQVEECTIMYDDDGKQYWIRKNTNKILIEEPVEIHGRLDIVFKLLNEAFLADIKTVSTFAWKYIEKKNQPKESHYAQVQLYLKDQQINKGILLYINKSTGDMKEFLIEYDEEYVTTYLDNLKQLKESIMKDGLPPRIFDSGDEPPWQCSYCSFTQHCIGMNLQQLKKTKYVIHPDKECEHTLRIGDICQLCKKDIRMEDNQNGNN